MLRTLEALGGSASRKDVIERIHAEHRAQLPDATWAWILENHRIEWSRMALRDAVAVATDGGAELDRLGKALKAGMGVRGEGEAEA